MSSSIDLQCDFIHISCRLCETIENVNGTHFPFERCEHCLPWRMFVVREHGTRWSWRAACSSLPFRSRPVRPSECFSHSRWNRLSKDGMATSIWRRAVTSYIEWVSADAVFSDLSLEIDICEPSPLLRVGLNEPCLGMMDTFVRLYGGPRTVLTQGSKVMVKGEAVPWLLYTLAWVLGLAPLIAQTKVGLAAEAHHSLTLELHFEETRCALVMVMSPLTTRHPGHPCHGSSSATSFGFRGTGPVFCLCHGLRIEVPMIPAAFWWKPRGVILEVCPSLLGDTGLFESLDWQLQIKWICVAVK